MAKGAVWAAVTGASVVLAAGAAVGTWYAVSRHLTPAASSASAPSAPSAAPETMAGAAWDGSIGGLSDFRLRDPHMREGVLELRYEAWPHGASASPHVHGTMIIAIAHRKVKMVLRSGDDKHELRTFDGILFADGRSIAGLSYVLPRAAPSEGGTLWWATIDRATPPAHPARPQLNDVTVGELTAFLGREDAARLVVGRRFIEGPYHAAADVDAVKGLDADAIKKLKEGTDAR